MSEADYGRALAVAIEAAEAASAIVLAECALQSGPRGPLGKCPADVEAEWDIRRRLQAAFPDWRYVGEETAPAGVGESDYIWLVDPNDGTQAMQNGHRGSAVSIGLLYRGVPVLGVVRAVNAPDDDGDLFTWAEGSGPLRRNGQPVERAPWPTALGPQEVIIISQSAARRPDRNLAAVAPARFRDAASIAYRLALVAAGEGAAGLGLTYPGAWDFAGGHALLRAVGGELVDERGRAVRYSRGGHSSTRHCFGGAPGLVQELAGRDWFGVSEGGFGPVAPPHDYRPVRLRPGRQVHDSGLLRRGQGCLLGQLVGDALGSLVEFESPRSIAARYPDGPRLLEDGGTWDTIAGQPTDDSELALVLARTLVARGGFDLEALAGGYAAWANGWTADLEPGPEPWWRPFDIGTTTAQALRAVRPEAVRAGRAAQVMVEWASRESQANGALMRVSPLGIWGWQHDLASVAEAARADARLSHPHPVCQEASALFAVTIAAAIRDGTSPEQTYARARDWMAAQGREAAVAEALERAASEPPADYQHNQGWVLLALQNAFYQLLQAPSLEEALVRTVRGGGDTDTNAAICGALLGAVYGREAVPFQWRQMVLSCRPFPGHPGVRQPRPAAYWPADALKLAERLLLASPER